MRFEKIMRKINNMMKVISMIVLSLFVLTGCVRMDAEYDFDKGMISGKLVTGISPELLSVDGKPADLKSKSDTEIAAACDEMGFAESTGDTSAEIAEDGWLQCTTTIPETPVNDFNGSESNGFDVSYNEENKQYTLNVKTPQEFNNIMQDDTASSNDSMKFVGTFNFNKVDTVTLDGTAIKDKAVEGVTKDRNTVKVDFTKIVGKEMKIVASDKNPIGVITIVGVIAGLLLISAAVFLVVSKNKKNEDLFAVGEKTEKNDDSIDTTENVGAIENNGASSENGTTDNIDNTGSVDEDSRVDETSHDVNSDEPKIDVNGKHYPDNMANETLEDIVPKRSQVTPNNELHRESADALNQKPRRAIDE